jgi:hypothetical protein
MRMTRTDHDHHVFQATTKIGTTLGAPQPVFPAISELNNMMANHSSIVTDGMDRTSRVMEITRATAWLGMPKNHFAIVEMTQSAIDTRSGRNLALAFALSLLNLTTTELLENCFGQVTHDWCTVILRWRGERNTGIMARISKLGTGSMLETVDEGISTRQKSATSHRMSEEAGDGYVELNK